MFDQLKKQELKEKTRQLSTKEGAVFSVMAGAGDSYFIPYALELKATNIQTGIFSGLANLFGPLAQIFGSKLIEKYNRKNIVTFSVLLQATTWLLFITLGLIFLNWGKTFYLIPLLILSYVLYSLFGSLGTPAWFSMMGDNVPEKIRGKYFSKRNRVMAIFSVISTALASICLYYAKQKGVIIFGFIILFAIASLARYFSAYLLSRHYSETIKLEKEYYFSFWRFIKKIPYKNFNKFTFYVSLINLSVNIAGPFFAVYMWKVLNFNPIWFTAVNISTGVFSFIFFPLWGHFADKYGNRELLRIGSILIIPIPLFWLFSGNPIYLMLIPQFISGLGWAAFNLAASNFIFDSIDQQRRALCVAYYNLLNGIGIFFGALLGGLLVQYVKLSFINAFLFLFIVSSVARFFVAVLILPKIKEVRVEHHPVSKNPLNYLREIKPIYGNFVDKVYPFKIHRVANFKNKIFFWK